MSDGARDDNQDIGQLRSAPAVSARHGVLEDLLAEVQRPVIEHLQRLEAQLALALAAPKGPTRPLTSTEAAAELKMHKKTVERHCRTGNIAAEKTKSGEWRIQPAAVEAFRRGGTADDDGGESTTLRARSILATINKKVGRHGS